MGGNRKQKRKHNQISDIPTSHEEDAIYALIVGVGKSRPQSESRTAKKGSVGWKRITGNLDGETTPIRSKLLEIVAGPRRDQQEKIKSRKGQGNGADVKYWGGSVERRVKYHET